MLAGLLTLGQIVAALTAIAVFLFGFYRWVVKPLMEIMKRVEAVIGSNGGSTLFQKLDGLEDRILMMFAAFDGLNQAMFMCDQDGEIASVNAAFMKLTGWPADRMKHGGFRNVMASTDRQEWDDAVQQTAIFDKSDVRIRTSESDVLHANIMARPVFNGERLIGWCGSVNPQ